jgi:hypothetical protein
VRRAAGAAALAAATLAAGCGGASKPASSSAPLAWQGTPVSYASPDLPRDRVLLAKVRNTSSAPVRLDAAKLVVRDAADRELRSSGRYIAGYAHGLYGAFQKPDPLPPDELKRMGLLVTLAPGRTAPIFVAWRLTPGAKEPARVDYGGGSLALPERTTPSS